MSHWDTARRFTRVRVERGNGWGFGTNWFQVSPRARGSHSPRGDLIALEKGQPARAWEPLEQSAIDGILLGSARARVGATMPVLNMRSRKKFSPCARGAGFASLSPFARRPLRLPQLRQKSVHFHHLL